MLIIRKPQVETFDRAARLGFEDEMARHLRQFAPPLAEAAGEPSLRAAIGLGIDRAEAAGLTNRGPVRLYLELMMMFGGDFATDPLLRWAAEALAPHDGLDQGARALALHRASLNYLESVVGPKDTYWVEAVRRLAGMRLEDYLDAGESFPRIALAALTAIYPQKAAYAGEPALRALIARGPEQAQRHGIGNDLGAILMIVLPFLVGHGCAVDPFYPWISGLLKEPAGADPKKRAERLLTRSRTYLNEALAYLEGP